MSARRLATACACALAACGKDAAAPPPPVAPPPPPPAPVAIPATLPLDTQTTAPIRAVACARDAYAAAIDDRVFVWELDGRLRATLPVDGQVPALALSRDGARLLAASGVTATLFDAHTGAALVRYGNLGGNVEDVALLADGRAAIAARTLQIWRDDARERAIELPDSSRPGHLALSADGASLALTALDAAAYVFDTRTFAAPTKIALDHAYSYAAYAPDGTLVTREDPIAFGPAASWLVLGGNGWAHLARYPSFGIVDPLSATTTEAETGGSIAAICPDGLRIVVGYGHGTLLVWATDALHVML